MIAADILRAVVLFVPILLIASIAAGAVGFRRQRYPYQVSTNLNGRILKPVAIAIMAIIVLAFVVVQSVLIFQTGSGSAVPSLPATQQPELVALFLFLTILAVWFTLIIRGSFQDMWVTLINEYFRPGSWPSIDVAPKTGWRWTMKWWFIQHPEPLDIVTIDLMRKAPYLEDFDARVKSNDYSPEHSQLLKGRHWGPFAGTVKTMIENQLVKRVFRSPLFERIGKVPGSAYQDVRKALLCLRCSGQGISAGVKCSECNRAGFLQAECGECSGTGSIDINALCSECQALLYPRPDCWRCHLSGWVEKRCSHCNGTGNVVNPHPILFMKRLQYYWMLFVIVWVERVKGILLGPWLTLLVLTLGITLFGVPYYFFSFGASAIATLASADFVVRLLFAAASLLCVYTCTWVVLAMLLMFRSTNTLDLVYPLRDATFGDPLWPILARLGGLCAIFSFTIYSFGMSVLVFGDDFLAGRIPIRMIVIIVITFMYSALLLAAIIYKTHLLMVDAKDSRLRELEYNMDVLDESPDQETLIQRYNEIRALPNWPLSSPFGGQVVLGFLLPTSIQVSATLFQPQLFP